MKMALAAADSLFVVICWRLWQLFLLVYCVEQYLKATRAIIRGFGYRFRPGMGCMVRKVLRKLCW